MIALREVDLATLAPAVVVPTDDVWLLVRAGPRTVGQVRFPDESPTSTAPTPLAPFLRRHFASKLAELAWSDAVLSTGVARDGLGAADVTILVCTRERPDMLVGCLEALGALAPSPGAVLVVDNAPSTDRTRRLAESAGVELVTEPVAGLNRARNAGWRHARTPLVAYVDDDARVDRLFASAVAKAFLDEGVGAMSGLVLPFELRTRAQITFERNGGMAKGFDRRMFVPGSVGVQSFRLGVGTNVAFRRTALEQIGGFDPAIGVGTPSRGGGDLEALWRVLSVGNDVLYEPDAIVRHIHRATSKELVAQHRDYGTAYAAFLTRISKHGVDGAGRELIRWHARRHVVDLVRGVVTGDRERARLLLAELAGSRSWHRR